MGMEGELGGGGDSGRIRLSLHWGLSFSTQGRWQEGRWFGDEEVAAETMGRWIGVVVVEGWGGVVETWGEGSQGGVWACCFDGMFGFLCLRIASSVRYR